MANAVFTNRVYVRDFKGRFLQRYEEKKRRAIADTVKEGARLAVMFAPKRTGALAASIQYTVGTSGGTWSVGTGHGLVQELGGRAHPLPGNVTFFWKKADRFWTPGYNDISHPGNPAVHFMRRSYDAVAPQMIERMRVS